MKIKTRSYPIALASAFLILFLIFTSSTALASTTQNSSFTSTVAATIPVESNSVALGQFMDPLSVQPAPEIEWQKSFGSTGNEVATSVCQTSDGCYIVAGLSNSKDGNVTGNHGGYDYWVIKLDSNGNIVWQKSLGGSNYDYAYSIQQTSDGGHVVAGHSESNDGNVTGNHGYDDYWVVKLDANGNIVWQKSLGGSGDDQASSIQQTSDGGYIVAGYSSSIDGNVTGNQGIGDFWVVKLDANGNTAWQKSLGGSSFDYAQSIQQTFDGGYIVAGLSNSKDGNVTAGNNVQKAWVVKLDASGNIVWQKCLLDSSSGAYSIQQTSDSGYIVAGNVYGDYSLTKINPDALVSNFSAIPVSGLAPLKVFFTDQSVGSPTSWSWDFGDRNTSTEQNPVHVYSAAGNYTVNLTVSNENGNASKSATVTVLKVPVSPGYTNPPTDPNNDGLHEDINGNGRLDFDDVVAYYDNVDWIEENAPVAFFDYNKNGLIDFDDVVKLYGML